MQKTFEPQEIEKDIYSFWENSNYFAASGEGDPYCIVIPPPNVTGSLHMGHGFQYSIMDALIRYHRMLKFNTHWQVGTDHAGIATQLLVENQLVSDGKSKFDLGREKFEEKVWEWKEFSKNCIYKQMRRMGISVDWQKDRFTLDPEFSKAVQDVFVRLYEEDLIYRGEFLVNWDPVLKTAVSDLEVNFVEQEGELWYIRYPLVDNSGFLEVATTRPETIFGDTAVAVNPEDERYQNLIGKKLSLPLTERTIPIIADASVAKEFGSGAVKITPAHDFNDYATGSFHNLPRINIFTKDAHLNENVPVEYRGMERFEARKKIVADLKCANLIAKIDSYCNKIPKGDRSGAVLEPYLTKQWFVRAKPLAERAIASFENGDFAFYPGAWGKTYLNWLINIQDWCISRQLWWGHRIPAWYDEAGNVYVGNSLEEVRAKHDISPDAVLSQDEDVLDTWFSASLWPFSSLGWPNETSEFKTFYPTDVLVTGFDIIFFWVARMVMMGLKFTDKVPFKAVYITGLIRDGKGQKMSKSKGNIIDPIDLIDGISLDDLIKKRTSNLLLASNAKAIEKATREEFPSGIPAFGTDALRFTFCSLASSSRDINFDLSRLEGNRNFCNKLWNAARFVLMNVKSKDQEVVQNVLQKQSLVDLWIRSKFQQLLFTVNQYFREYRFDLVAQAIYEFAWHEYCDWYLEFCKPTLNSKDSDIGFILGAKNTLLGILEKLLRVIHPLMPFISEKIWQEIIPLIKCEQNDGSERCYCDSKNQSLMLVDYPLYDASEVNIEAVQKIEWLKRMILAIRNVRGEIRVAPGKTVNILLKKGGESDRFYLNETELYLKYLARVENISWVLDEEKIPTSSCALLGELEIYIPLDGLVDLEAEKTRLAKEIQKLQKEREVIEQKLFNPNFVAKAPENVVSRERLRLQEISEALEKLRMLD